MVNIVTAASNGNWDDGRLVTVTPGSTYTCTNVQNAATGIFLYNASNTDHDISLWVTTANVAAPVKVTVPGTTGQQGLATIVAVNGSVTGTVSVSMDATQPSNSQVQAFLGSTAFPINTAGITNTSLPTNGSTQSFQKFTRFYDVPASTWYSLTLTSNVTQFLCAQFAGSASGFTVYCLNPGPNAAASVVQADPNNPVAVKFVVPTSGQEQKLQQNLFGNGQQYVWINADSIQNSQSATISLQQIG